MKCSYIYSQLSVFDMLAVFQPSKHYDKIPWICGGTNLHDLYPLIPYVRLAITQDNVIFKENDIKKCTWLLA